MPAISPTQRTALEWLNQPSASGLGDVRSILVEPGAPQDRTCEALAKRGVGYGAINSVRCKLSLARFTVDPSDPNNP